MQSKYIRCVKIIHHPAEVRVYRTLSAFFRFVGIFVCENLEGDEYGDEVDYVCRVEKGTEDGNEPWENQVTSILDEMKEKFGEENFKTIKNIWEIFFRNDLMRRSYAVDYFADTGREYIYCQMEEGMKAFEKALRELELLEQSLEKNFMGKVYLWMGKANCRRRISELYVIIWNAIKKGKYKNEVDSGNLLKDLYREHHIDFNAFLRDIQSVLDEEPRFFAAYAVRGFAKEINDEYKVDSVDDIKTAVSMIGNKSYTSYLQYRIGRYYEKIRPNMDQKMDYYRMALEVDHHNYRALYKLAMYEQDLGNYEKSMELWERVLKILGEKKNLASLQPIECAYLYKANRKIGWLYNRMRDYEIGIQYLKEAESVYDNKENEDREKGFYPWMFGTDLVESDGGQMEIWEVYKRAAKDKLQIWKVYVAIADTSARANMQADHAKYVGKMVKKRMLV